MGDNVSLLDSFIVTVFSMVVVFLVLILIAYLINLLKVMSNGKKDEKKPQVIAKDTEDLITKELNQEENQDQDDEELVAVIAAAVAASMGLNIPDINIKTIRRVPQNSNAWSEMGKREHILGKL